MDKFRYFVDVGSGWVSVTPFQNNLEWINANDINPVITRVTLTGSASFLGDDYDIIKTFKDADNVYIPIKVEQYDGSWNNIYEGNADLRDSWDENKKIIKISKFNNSNDPYDNLLSNYKLKYGLKHLFIADQFVINTPADTSTTVDAVLVPGTGLSPVNYQQFYDINGLALWVPGTTDPRWATFLFRSTNGDGSHNFETMSYGYNPGEENVYGYTSLGMVVNGVYNNLWTKLPPGIGANETFSRPIVYNFNRFADVIESLVDIASNVVTFDKNTATTYTGQTDDEVKYSHFDFLHYQFGEASQAAENGGKGSEISLFDTFEIMRTAFNLFWYLDGNALKFKHTSEIGAVGTLDLTSQTEHLKRLDYINASDIPDVEVFETNDAQGVFEVNKDTWGSLAIYYRGSNIDLVNIRTKTNKINISTNVRALMAGEIDTGKNNFALIETIDDIQVSRTAYGTMPDVNLRLSSNNLYGHLNKWRYGFDPSYAGRLKIASFALGDTEPRPLLKLPTISYHISLLTDYDMQNNILTSAGDARTKIIKQKLSGDTLEVEVEL